MILYFPYSTAIEIDLNLKGFVVNLWQQCSHVVAYCNKCALKYENKLSSHKMLLVLNKNFNWVGPLKHLTVRQCLHVLNGWWRIRRVIASCKDALKRDAKVIFWWQWPHISNPIKKHYMTYREMTSIRPMTMLKRNCNLRERERDDQRKWWQAS